MHTFGIHPAVQAVVGIHARILMGKPYRCGHARTVLVFYFIHPAVPLRACTHTVGIHPAIPYVVSMHTSFWDSPSRTLEIHRAMPLWTFTRTVGIHPAVPLWACGHARILLGFTRPAVPFWVCMTILLGFTKPYRFGHACILWGFIQPYCCGYARTSFVIH